MTRKKTRMIFVEEVLDNDKGNNVYKSFEMQSQVTKSPQGQKSKQQHSSQPGNTNEPGTSKDPNSESHNPKDPDDYKQNPTSVKKGKVEKSVLQDSNIINDEYEQSEKEVNVHQPEMKNIPPSIDESCLEDPWEMSCTSVDEFPDDILTEEGIWVTQKNMASPTSNDSGDDFVGEHIDIEVASIGIPEKAPLSVSTSLQSGVNLPDNPKPPNYSIFEVPQQQAGTERPAETTPTPGKTLVPPEENPEKQLRDSMPNLPRSKRGSILGGIPVMPLQNIPAFAKLRNMHHQDELKTIEDSLLYQKLRNLFLCMKITGIFFVRQQRTSEGSRTKFIRNCTFQQAYCTLILVVLTVNFIRSLTAFSDANFNELGSVLFFKFLTSIFFYESMSRSYLTYVAAYRKKGGLEDLFLCLERICYPDGILPYEESLIRISNVFIVLTFLISVSNVGATAYGFFGPDPVQELFWNYLRPVDPNVDGIIYFKAFLLILTFVNAQVAILSLSFYSVVCYVLYKEFEYLCRTFSLKIREDGQFIDDLERFRIAHQKRCKLVVQTDQMFKYYIANTYVTNIPLLILLLYSVVYTDYEESYRFISAFRMCYVLLQMLVVSVAATIINTEAHAPLAHIHSIRVSSASVTPARQLEVNMFLNKLTGTSIGLTAWDMFVINKPAVLTVIGMILTYFFLLLQFKNPLQGGALCNCLVACNGTNVTFPGGL